MKFKLKLIALWASLLLLSGCKAAPVYDPDPEPVPLPAIMYHSILKIVWVWIRRFTEGHGIASHYGYDGLYVQLLKYGQYVCKVIEISVVQSHQD